MESALFHDFFGNFYMILFLCTQGELNPHEVRLKQTLENSELSKTQIFFWMEGTFGGWGGVYEVRYVRSGM